MDEPLCHVWLCSIVGEDEFDQDVAILSGDFDSNGLSNISALSYDLEYTP